MQRTFLPKLLSALLLSSNLHLSAFAADTAQNPLSVHVLDQVSGQPSAGIGVRLEKQEGAQWRLLARAETDVQGRIRGLYPANQPLSAGIYRVTFETGAFFARHKTPTFFPEIPVLFEVQATSQHYHIPLLLSPFGYATYRGN